jgi:hypothetical protein
LLTKCVEGAEGEVHKHSAKDNGGRLDVILPPPSFGRVTDGHSDHVAGHNEGDGVLTPPAPTEEKRESEKKEVVS